MSCQPNIFSYKQKDIYNVIINRRRHNEIISHQESPLDLRLTLRLLNIIYKIFSEDWQLVSLLMWVGPNPIFNTQFELTSL